MTEVKIDLSGVVDAVVAALDDRDGGSSSFRLPDVPFHANENWRWIVDRLGDINEMTVRERTQLVGQAATCLEALGEWAAEAVELASSHALVVPNPVNDEPDRPASGTTKIDPNAMAGHVTKTELGAGPWTTNERGEAFFGIGSRVRTSSAKPWPQAPWVQETSPQTIERNEEVR